MDISIRSLSSNHIDASIKWKGYAWRFTGFYEHPNASKRVESCKLLKRIHNDDNSTWLVDSDLNEILWNFEKEGGARRRSAQIENFRETLDNCNLVESNFVGDQFRWINRRQDEAQVRERLYRFLINDAFINLFLEYRIRHLQWARSDHGAIECNLFGSGSGSG